MCRYLGKKIQGLLNWFRKVYDLELSEQSTPKLNNAEKDLVRGLEAENKISPSIREFEGWFSEKHDFGKYPEPNELHNFTSNI